jgi:hypothetical protein
MSVVFVNAEDGGCWEKGQEMFAVGFRPPAG